MVPLKKILHPTDFSESGKHAFHLACSLARDHDAHLVVAHVAQPGPGIPLPETFSQQLWEQLLQLQDSAAKVRLEHLLRAGDPAAEIPRLAQEPKCDLIVHAVFSKASCLVLIVRSPFPVLGTGTEPAPTNKG